MEWYSGFEENYESKMIDDVEATVTRYYGVDEVTELTRDFKGNWWQAMI